MEKMHKRLKIFLSVMVVLAFSSPGLLWSDQIGDSTKQQNSDSETKIRASLSKAAKKDKFTKRNQKTNEQRIKDFPVLLKNVQAMLTKPFGKEVNVFLRSGNGKVRLVENYKVDYTPSVQAKSPGKTTSDKDQSVSVGKTPVNVGGGFTIKEGKSSTRFDPQVTEWLSSLLADPKWINAFANFYEVKVDKKDKSMSKVSRKFVMIPKVSLPNIRLAYLYFGKSSSSDKSQNKSQSTSEITMIEVLNLQRGYMVYDFGKNITPTPSNSH